ncbi:MAG: PCP reductase family protein [Candidatus Poribacteria bacterium]|nr:PCP reductase family protein [Candidatus Poribacteria bacterium]
MKFLCLECNTAMQFKEAAKPEQGSLTAIFECPDCFAEFAMHMNPWETQMLKSLNVQLGGKSEAAQPMQMVRSFLSEQGGATAATDQNTQTTTMTPESEGGKCPFTSVVADAFQEPDSSGPVWTPEALARLERVPSFVRPMAKTSIEEFARENGHTEITTDVMDSARGSIGM